MIELPLLFVAGILGSAHCVGMCGPFALTIGESARRWHIGLLRQVIYSAGRIATYAFLGSAVGYGGYRLTTVAPALLYAPAVLSVAAGLFLVWQALIASGLWKRGPLLATNSSPCLASGFLGGFLRGKSRNIFLAGVVTGFLPCGLLYGTLGLATSTCSAFGGGIAMVTFGLGTMPLMIVTGLGGQLLGMTLRHRLHQLAVASLALTGVVSLIRGVVFLCPPRAVDTGCPFCP